MLKEQKNSRKQGDVGLGSAISYFTKLGYTICIPLTDNQDYDLVIDNGNSLKKVSIKTTTQITNAGNYYCDLRITGGNRSRNYEKKFDKSLIDFLYILTESNNEYCIPVEKINVKNGLTLSKKFEKFNCKTGV